VRPAAAVLAVVAGLGCVLLGVTAVLTPGGPVTPGTAAGDRSATIGAGAPPAALLIPDLGLVLTPVVELGHVDGRREQPGTALGVGWFADGPAPGAPGVAVLSAHAGFGWSNGAFARLDALKPGALDRAGQHARRPGGAGARAAPDHQRRSPRRRHRPQHRPGRRLRGPVLSRAALRRRRPCAPMWPWLRLTHRRPPWVRLTHRRPHWGAWVVFSRAARAARRPPPPGPRGRAGAG
jgi:hypothetical protein